MGIKISDMTPKGSADGTELIPVSHSGSPYSINPADIKNYTIDQIEAIGAAGSVTGADGVYILQGGVLKPADIDLIAQHAIDTMWGKAAETSPDDADIFLLKDGGTTEKTVTAAYVASYILSAIEGDILDISDLSTGTPADADLLLLCQGSVGKKITYLSFYTAVLDALNAYVTALTAVTSTANTDVFYCIQGGVEKKVTLADIVAHVGAPVTKSGSTTEDNIPQWTATDGQLKDGLTLATGDFGAGDSTTIPTTQSVRTVMDTIVDDATDIGAALVDADEILVDDASSTQKKSTFTRIWTWIVSKLQAVTDLSSYSWFLDDDTMAADDATKVASQQSIKAYVDDLTVDKFMTLTVGTGISGGTGTICAIRVSRVGTLYKTEILVDLTGLRSTAADDIIGVDGTSNPCYICQITAAESGTIISGKITCFETPAGSTPDVDLYSAVEGTGVEDTAISTLTETKLINHGAWTAEEEDILDTMPSADEYLYLVAGATLNADYTAGILLIELWGT